MSGVKPGSYRCSRATRSVWYVASYYSWRQFYDARFGPSICYELSRLGTTGRLKETDPRRHHGRPAGIACISCLGRKSLGCMPLGRLWQPAAHHDSANFISLARRQVEAKRWQKNALDLGFAPKLPLAPKVGKLHLLVRLEDMQII